MIIIMPKRYDNVFSVPKPKRKVNYAAAEKMIKANPNFSEATKEKALTKLHRNQRGF
jgi:hypothetical protein